MVENGFPWPKSRKTGGNGPDLKLSSFGKMVENGSPGRNPAKQEERVHSYRTGLLNQGLGCLSVRNLDLKLFSFGKMVENGSLAEISKNRRKGFILTVLGLSARG